MVSKKGFPHLMRDHRITTRRQHVTLDDFEAQLEAVDWNRYETAYGVATPVPDQLRRLLSPDREVALQASHDLWCGLCHQHAYVSSAALPALPFLVRALENADEQIAIEILDILKGFAVCTWPRGSDCGPEWLFQLREDLSSHTELIARFRSSPNEEVRDFAEEILERLGSAES